MSRPVVLTAVAALVATAALSYAAAVPRRVVADLSAALASGQEDALRERIDFDALREDLKQQLLRSFVAASPDDRVAMAASRFVGPLVEGLVTPSALSRLGGESSGLVESDARWRGTSEIVVAVPGAGEEPSLWRLERRGLSSFVLVGIELPSFVTTEMRRQWSARLAAAPLGVDDNASLDENRARACAAWRKVALARLQALTLAQRAHHAEHGRYADDVALLGDAPVRGPDLYDFVVTQADALAFVVEARGTGLMDEDTLVADKNGIRVLQDRCAP